MAVRSEFLRGYTAENGPWAYHFCSPGRRGCVLARGLQPAEINGSSSALTDECLRGRPGHVYLCLGVGVALVVDQSFGFWDPHDPVRMQALAERAVAVDLRVLDPSRISPDEDCCYGSTLTYGVGEDVELPMPGASDPGLTVRDRFSFEGHRESREVFAARPYSSYGEWAEAQQVGADVEHSQQCFVRFGSLAYREAIPPTALRACTLTDLLALVVGVSIC